MMNINELIKEIKNHNPQADTDSILKAYECANKAHLGQVRKSGEPYIIHPLQVATIIANMGLDIESIIAGILHDCIEDTEFDYAKIKEMFGEDVADLVDGVTRLGMIRYSKEQEQMEDLRKMFMAMAKDIRVILIKLADRLHNMRTIKYMPEHKRSSKALETMEIYAPIAHRLGMQAVKWELEDLSMEILDPIGFKEITDGLQTHKEERELFLNSNKEKIINKLGSGGINATIEGRVKHIYSIYRKMYSQHKTMDEIYDICAVRVIVDDVVDCYNTLGHMHDIYKPIPGRFKDYIACPKPNGYRSLHTTVIGRAGIPFEIQIRTAEMHKMSELGVAAHWKYKEGLDKNSSEETFAWIRQLLEAQQDSEAEEFIKTIKVDLFSDEVFVFTPKGEVISMPAGAISIDFAYAIHSAVGNRMVGCKINGKIASIDTPLKNGDIVEIITTKETHGPSRDWLKLIKTSEARNKIRQWFKKECLSDNIERGREDLFRELRAYLIFNTFMETEGIQTAVLKKYNFETLDDLYASIGYGGISLTKILNRIKDDVIKLRKQQEKTDKVSPQKAKKSDTGVIVEGIDSCLIKFARCCSALPGDDIIGFITRGYGISVHKKDCVNVINSAKEDADRWISVQWDEEYLASKGRFNTNLQISSATRMGIISETLAVFNNLKIPVLEMNAKDLSDGYSIMNVVAQISGKNQFDNLINKLKSVSGVIDVKRSIS